MGFNNSFEPALCKVQIRNNPRQVGLTVLQQQNCWRTVRTCEFCSCYSKARLTISHRTQLSWHYLNGKPSPTATGFPTLSSNTVPALSEVVDTTGPCLCLRHVRHIMNAGNFKLQHLFPWQWDYISHPLGLV